MPITWLVIIALIAVFTNSQLLRKIMIRLNLGLVLFFSNPFIIHILMQAWEVPVTPIANLETYEVGIVLTGFTIQKEPEDRVYMDKGADRIMHALLLYRKGKIKKILITGGTVDIFGVESKSEASKLKDVLLLAGMPEDDIILEEKAKNTRENALFTAEILRNQFPDKKYLLITSAFHLRRATDCFTKAGIEVFPFSTDFYTSDSNSLSLIGYLIPSENSFHRWNVLIHEVTGYLVYKLIGYC